MTAPASPVLPVSDLEPPGRPVATRALGLLIALLLVAALVSAALVRPEDRTPEERFAAIQAAVAEEPFAFEITFDGAMPGMPQPLEFAITGAADPAVERTRAEMDLSALLPAGATSGAMPTSISFVSEGNTLYVRRPGPAEGARWTKVDAAALTGGATGPVPSSTNPLDSFEQLRAVDAEIEEVGEEDVRGTSTTHFRTRLDMSRILDSLPPERRPALGSVEAERLSSMEDVDVDVWLDDRDRPRRQRMAFQLPSPDGTTPAGTMTITIEAFDFGTPVDIDLPPAELVDEGTNPFGAPPS